MEHDIDATFAGAIALFAARCAGHDDVGAPVLWPISSLKSGEIVCTFIQWIAFLSFRIQNVFDIYISMRQSRAQPPRGGMKRVSLHLQSMLCV